MPEARSRLSRTLPERADESQKAWIYLITDPVAIITVRGRREQEKRSGALDLNQPREWVDRQRDGKRDAEHVQPYSCTQRLRSMLR